MAESSVSIASKAGLVQRLAAVWHDVVAGASVGATLLPPCMAAGVVAFGPLGPDYATAGLAAALLATIVGGSCTALLSTSSFIVTFPLPSIAAVQGSLVLSLLALPAFAGHSALVLPAMAAAVLLSGVLITVIGLTGIARIIKYTPHPVMAGFKNGISLTLIWLALKPFIDSSMQQPGWLPFLAHPMQLVATLLMLGVVVGLDSLTRKVPAGLASIVIGTLCYLAAQTYLPGVDLGHTVGTVAMKLPPAMPLLEVSDPDLRGALVAAFPVILQFAAVLAVVATLQTLLVYRLAQTLDDVPVRPGRDLVALGIGTCLSAAVGGLSISGASGQSSTAFRAGGRTRLVGVSLGIMLLALSTLAPGVLGSIPIAAVSAIVVHTAIQTLDPWSVALVKRVLRTGAGAVSKRDWYDLSIVAAVMLATAFVAVLPGVAVGVALACLVFIVNMSRPLIRRRLDGTTLTSKRVRSQRDASFLRSSGSRRAILEINGVLFFGNTESLAEEVSRLFAAADMVLLDCRGVSDVDASGAAILRTLVERGRKQKKRIVVCNVPVAFVPQFEAIWKQGQQPAPFLDLDTSLEWMEEQVLSSRSNEPGAAEEIPLERHDFVRGLEAGELRTFAASLIPRTFVAGDVLCNEGEAGDRMWLLTKGSVSIRIETADARRSRRLASLATGTTVGEMALIEDGRRSATIVANEEVSTLELSRSGYQEVLAQHPAIAAKLFGNLLREMAARIRDNHVDLRESVS